MLDYLRENLSRTLRDWEGWQAVLGLGVILVSALGLDAYRQDASLGRWAAVAAGLYLAVMLLFVTPFRMWHSLRRELEGMEAGAKPHLVFEFEPDKLPYLQEQLLTDSGDKPYLDRRFRVGIRNDSSRVIPNVRVVLESFHQLLDSSLRPATPEQPVYLEHALNIMGRDDKHGLVDVAPGDRPTAFADVIVQTMNSSGTEGDWMSPCYASGHFTMLFSRSDFVLGLRVEGGGTFSRARFKVGATLEDRKIAFVPYPVG